MDEKQIVLAKASENKAEILALTDKINLDDPNSIVVFGKEAADEISKCSDIILNSVDIDKVNGTSGLMVSLTNIMNQFDAKELSEERESGFFGKLFGGAKNSLEKLLNKYNTMGGEIEKVYIELKKYEDELKDSNNKLEILYNTNLEYYETLTRYILAGEEGVRQIEAYRAEIEKKFNDTNEAQYQIQLQTLDMGKQMLEQRVQDLRIAENIALQTIPMIKSMQFSNFNLVRKINSAFIITLPVFKQSLAQAVLLKRQKVQAEAMSALDEKTNEMLLKNAENTMLQTKLTTQLASSSSVKMETLEKTWKTIMDGIAETKRIQVEASQQREQDKIKLAEYSSQFLKISEK